MKSDGLLKRILAVFVVAMVLYVVAYSWIEHRRHRKGPWRVTFTRDGGGEAALSIDQPALGITNAGIVFQGTRVPANFSSSVLTFAEPPLPRDSGLSNRTDRAEPIPYDVPFGRCAFMDTTFLPGTIVFTNVFGHEIQLIPRVLTIDKREYPWRSGKTLVISGTNVSEQP